MYLRQLLRPAALAAALLASVPDPGAAQGIEWGVKAGVNAASVNAVPDYYDWLLCCEPGRPDARVDSAARPSITGAGFVAFPLTRRLAIQGELLISRRRHAVDLEPYEPIDITFTRDYVEAAGLVKLEVPVAGRTSIYVAGGPVFGYRIGEEAKSSDPRLDRGNPETEVYVVQLLAYAAPELLRTGQTSLALTGGLAVRRLLVEVRFTQGLQSVFKSRGGLRDGLVSVGGDPETVDRLLPRFAPFLESGRSRDLAVLVGMRF
jgi:hypothetical protein